MTTIDSAEALIGEHREIDADIEAFLEGLKRGDLDRTPLGRAFDALRRHIYLEEALLFPPIKRAGMMMPILVMIKEHGEVWHVMDEIEHLLASTAPEPELIRSRCTSLLNRLGEHNAKEEPIIYPHTSLDLTDDESDALADFIATGSMPAGWVCEAAL